MINPGFVDTPMTAGNDFAMPALMQPDAAARAILAGWAAGRYEMHFPRRFTLLMKLFAAPRRTQLFLRGAPRHAAMNVPMPGGSSTDARVRRGRLRSLDGSAARLDALLALYASDARFRDPFNNVRGHAALRNIFEHMATQVREPRFASPNPPAKVTPPGCAGISASPAAASTAPAGFVRRRWPRARTPDFWDPAWQLYERVPLLGALMPAAPAAGRRRRSAEGGRPAAPARPEPRADSRCNRDNACITSHYTLSSDAFAVIVKTPKEGCLGTRPWSRVTIARNQDVLNRGAQQASADNRISSTPTAR